MGKFRADITNFLNYIICSETKTENNKTEWSVLNTPAYAGGSDLIQGKWSPKKSPVYLCSEPIM